MTNSGGIRLTTEMREALIQLAVDRKLKRLDGESASEVEVPADVPDSWCRFDRHPGYRQLRILQEGGECLGIENPYFRIHDGMAGATTRIDGKEFINFSSYNYLGLSGHPVVSEAAKAAIDRYGTSVSASRVVSGERLFHRELEREIARLYGVDDAVLFVSGHATNVTTIGCLFGPNDLVLHDALIHNSVLQGIAMSKAKRVTFGHNDWGQLDRLLADQRRRYERVLIVVEGLYSMDGDVPDLPRFIQIKQKHRAFLMVDEAHSIGVLGGTGKGVREHFGLDGGAVDIWMGTLSKALASCGGFIAGESALIEHLRYLAPAFLYSVGMAPPVAAAALAALRYFQTDPDRVFRLQENGRRFFTLAKQAGLNTGTSQGLAVVPVITGSSVSAVRLSEALFRQGIHVQPIIHPAVPEQAARLRFFLSSEHTEDHVRRTVEALAAERSKG
ncbi:MAG TPA: aminotransferase class I/II-fold pyridoxal phosphate-dependent enzyme [Nitrospira sp.]